MRSNSKPPSQRQLRVGEQVRHLLSECFTRGHVPEALLDIPPVSVMEARVSPDFSFCKVFIVPLGNDAELSSELVKRLNLSRGFFRTVLAKNLRLRVAPEVRFFADESFREADRIEALLASEKVRRDLAPRPDEEE